jgi:hypothetical protein
VVSVLLLVPDLMNLGVMANAFLHMRKNTNENSETYFVCAKEVSIQSITFVFLTVSNSVTFILVFTVKTAAWFFSLILVTILLTFIG